MVYENHQQYNLININELNLSTWCKLLKTSASKVIAMPHAEFEHRCNELDMTLRKEVARNLEAYRREIQLRTSLNNSTNLEERERGGAHPCRNIWDILCQAAEDVEEMYGNVMDATPPSFDNTYSSAGSAGIPDVDVMVDNPDLTLRVTSTAEIGRRGSPGRHSPVAGPSGMPRQSSPVAGPSGLRCLPNCRPSCEQNRGPLPQALFGSPGSSSDGSDYGFISPSHPFAPIPPPPDDFNRTFDIPHNRTFEIQHPLNRTFDIPNAGPMWDNFHNSHGLGAPGCARGAPGPAREPQGRGVQFEDLCRNRARRLNPQAGGGGGSCCPSCPNAPHNHMRGHRPGHHGGHGQNDTPRRHIERPQIDAARRQLFASPQEGHGQAPVQCPRIDSTRGGGQERFYAEVHIQHGADQIQHPEISSTHNRGPPPPRHHNTTHRGSPQQIQYPDIGSTRPC